MANIYRQIETSFEKLTAFITVILGNSITFILALAMVVYFLFSKEFYHQDIRDCIRDVIHGVTFLTLFIIQKAFNRFSGSLHLKLNELVASHESANNAVINVEEKTEHEIAELSKEYTELSKEYAELAGIAKEEEAKIEEEKTEKLAPSV